MEMELRDGCQRTLPQPFLLAQHRNNGEGDDNGKAAVSQAALDKRRVKPNKTPDSFGSQKKNSPEGNPSTLLNPVQPCKDSQNETTTKLSTVNCMSLDAFKRLNSAAPLFQ